MKKNMYMNQKERMMRQQEARAGVINKWLLNVAHKRKDVVLESMDTSVEGLSLEQVEKMRENCGLNVISHEKKESWVKRLLGAFINPFTIVLLILATISIVTDVILAGQGEADFTTVSIVLTMVTISGVLRFVQETRSTHAAEQLSAMVKTTTCVQRQGVGKVEIVLEEVVNGDIIVLSAGDMVPADLRMIEAKDLFISQSALTGESEPVEKVVELKKGKTCEIAMECDNLAFMGTNVISGTARGVVVAIGDETLFGNLSKTIVSTQTVATLNDKGMHVIAVAQKTNPSVEEVFSVKDERDMVLLGYLAFLDPPKVTAQEAIRSLNEYGVEVKVLTGDNERVTASVCKQVGLSADKILLGADIEKMSDAVLAREVEKHSLFAKLSPQQKTRIVRILRNNDHVVGFMGDGINDAAAMKEADVGISVDTAVDIAKESAEVEPL
ncbi:MAG: HAD-IC family P-type ATPase [Niameybacter sp.]